jgi:CDP-4-dehydro-6-deoxyglucose reductase, E3
VAQWVTIWRAAQLVGVPRGVLQRRVRAGEIALSDGLVSTETLLELYPQTEIVQSGMLERVVHIKEDAFGRRVRERLLPSQDVLAQRLFRQGQELADAQRHLQRYHALVIELRDRIGEAVVQTSGDDARLLGLQRQLNEALARALATDSVDLLHVMDDILKVVAAQVTLRPSGHQFTVEGHETLLQAGLKAGLALNYGCGNGSCGMCKVRVSAGEVAKVMPCA